MTRELHTQGDFPVSPDAMLRIMTDPALLARQHRLQGAVEVEVEDSERSDERLVQTVKVREYWRNLKGVDESRIEKAQTVYTWNLAARSCMWTYRGPRGKQVRIGGAIGILPFEDGCRVLSDVTVEVPVPILGRILEKRIGAEIEAGFAPFEELLHEFCKKS
jgi:hypothetical protein